MLEPVGRRLGGVKKAGGKIQILAIGLGRRAAGRAGPVGGEWFGAVAPPRIHADGAQFPLDLIPIHTTGLGRKGIVGRAVGKEISPFLQLPVVGASGRGVRPERNHEPHGLLVQFVDKSRRIRITGMVERLLSPLSVRPVFPILDDHRQRHVPFAVFPDHLQEFLLGVIVLLGLDVTQGPIGQWRGFAGQTAKMGHQPVKLGPQENEEIQLVHRVDLEEGEFPAIVKDHSGAGVNQEAVTP